MDNLLEIMNHKFQSKLFNSLTNCEQVTKPQAIIKKALYKNATSNHNSFHR